MKKLLKLNPGYLIGIGIIVMSIGGYLEGDIGFGINLLGGTIGISGVIIGLIQRCEIIKKSKNNN